MKSENSPSFLTLFNKCFFSSVLTVTITGKKPTQGNKWVVQDFLVRDVDDLSGRHVYSRATEPESTCFKWYTADRNSAFGVLRSVFGVRLSAFGVRCSAFGALNSAFCDRRLAFGIRRSAVGVRQTTPAVHLCQKNSDLVTTLIAISENIREVKHDVYGKGQTEKK